MIVALTGTPGIGKTSVANILKDKGYKIVDITKVAIKEKFLTGNDNLRDSKIVNINLLNRYVKNNYKTNDTIFIEGHLSHLLNCVDKVIILRCHPNELKKRLSKKGWEDKKIKENIDAEILDVILCEITEIHSEDNIFEIDTTNITINSVASSVLEIVKNKFKNMKKYNIGEIDWSEEILKDF